MNEERQQILERTIKLLELLEKEDSKDIDIKKAIENITKIFSPDYERIPIDLRKALGIAYGTALSESDLPTCAHYTRKTLAILRTAIKRARGPQRQIEDVEKLAQMIDSEISFCERSETPVFDRLWKVTNQALGYISDRVFEGYGAFTSTGFGFTKQEFKGDRS